MNGPEETTPLQNNLHPQIQIPNECLDKIHTLEPLHVRDRRGHICCSPAVVKLQ